jgi:hypothetical protein
MSPAGATPLAQRLAIHRGRNDATEQNRRTGEEGVHTPSLGIAHDVTSVGSVYAMQNLGHVGYVYEWARTIADARGYRLERNPPEAPETERYGFVAVARKTRADSHSTRRPPAAEPRRPLAFEGVVGDKMPAQAPRKGARYGEATLPRRPDQR